MTETRRLSMRALGALRADVARPLYDRASVKPGIVHLGIGNFHRAHQAVYVDDCLAAGETDWGIVGVSLRSSDMRDALAAQDGLYALAVRGPDRTDLRVVGSILDVMVAPENPAALVARMAHPDTRIVTLTVTEKAYLRAASGALDASTGVVAHDLRNPAEPRSVYGFLLAALSQRRNAGVAPFTVLCCDNLPANGETIRRLMLEFCRLGQDADMAAYVENEVAFPSTMVDRIVPATTDDDRAFVTTELRLADAWPVVTEPFSQWVVEDRFTRGRPDWERHGVTMVDDVGPFEDMKLRMLNGAHSAIAYVGLLLDLQSVSASFGNSAVRGFVGALWAEAARTLPRDAGLDPDAYTARLAERFSNAALVHRTAQIATDGSQKLPQRVVGPARLNLIADRPVGCMTMVVAAWIACCEQRGQGLPAGHFTDPLDTPLAAIFRRGLSAAGTVAEVFKAAGFGTGEDDGDRELQAMVAQHLRTIRDRGIGAELERVAVTRP